MRFDFEQQNVVVTGGTRGIGRALALEFLKAGANVWAIYHSSTAAAEALQEAAGDLPGQVRLERLDVGDYDQVESFYQALDKDGVSVDVLVHCAGIRRDGVLAMQSSEDWQQVLRTNLDGSFHMCKFAILNMMRKRFGRIVLITSPAAHFGFPGQGNYSASKAGQIGLMRSLSKEGAKRGITVNCCSPGFIETGFIEDLETAQKDIYRKMVPMERFGQVEEVAHAVLFLADRNSTYINGTTLEVTGGL